MNSSPAEPFARNSLLFVPLSGAFLVLLAIALFQGFHLSEQWLGGFENLHRYGLNEENENWVFLFTNTERLYMLFLALFAIPAAIVLATGLRLLIPRSWQTGLLRVIDRAPATAFCIPSSLISFLAIWAVAHFTLEHVPITDDENVYLFMARILNEGKLYLNSHPLREFFDNVFIINNGRWYGQFPYGFPALLVPGLRIGAPWLLPFTAAALIPSLAFLIARRLYGSRTAWATGILMLASPYWLFTSATLQSQATSLFWISLAVLACLETGYRSSSLLLPAAASFAVGCALHTRPVSAVLLLPLPLLLAGIKVLRQPRTIPRLCALILPLACFAALFLTINYFVNGESTLTNYDIAWRDVAKTGSILGFDQYPWGIEHSPRTALINLGKNLLRINFWLHGWPLSLLFPLLYLAAPRKQLWDLVWSGSLLFTCILYFFYFWPGISDTGPVLYMECLLALSLLSARGFSGLARLAGGDEQGTLRAAALLSAIVVTALVTCHQLQVRVLHRVAFYADEPYRLMRTRKIDYAVVFMDYYLSPYHQKSWVAGRRNPASSHLDREPVLYVLNQNKGRRQLRSYYPRRKFYQFWYDGEEPHLEETESDLLVHSDDLPPPVAESASSEPARQRAFKPTDLIGRSTVPSVISRKEKQQQERIIPESSPKP